MLYYRYNKIWVHQDLYNYFCHVRSAYNGQSNSRSVFCVIRFITNKRRWQSDPIWLSLLKTCVLSGPRWLVRRCSILLHRGHIVAITLIACNCKRDRLRRYPTEHEIYSSSQSSCHCRYPIDWDINQPENGDIIREKLK